MKLFALSLVALLGAFSNPGAFAQTVARTPAPASSAAQLEALTKKIEEQNGKIDTLSQQILKLEQQIANMRPGVMIGESTPTPSVAASITTTASTTAPSPEGSAHPANGNSHVVARGETLTSIAKMHNVSVGELQKFNHIENDRKLQIGQTILLPASAASAVPAASASPSANE